MGFIVDVDLNELRKLSRGSSGLLFYEGQTTYELYYLNKGQLIFRTILKKDKNSMSLLSSLNLSVVINSPITQSDNSRELSDIKKAIERIELYLKLHR